MSKLDNLGGSKKRVVLGNNRTKKELELEKELLEHKHISINLEKKINQIIHENRQNKHDILEKLYQQKEQQYKETLRLERLIDKERMQREQADLQLERKVLDVEQRVMREIQQINTRINELTFDMQKLDIKHGQEIMRVDHKIDRVVDKIGMSIKDLYIMFESGLYNVKELINAVDVKRKDLENNLEMFKVTHKTEYQLLENRFEQKIKETEQRFEGLLNEMKEDIKDVEYKFKDIGLQLQQMEVNIAKFGQDNEKIKTEAMALLKDINFSHERLHNALLTAEYSAEAIGNRIVDRIKDKIMVLKDHISQKEKQILELNFAGREQALELVAKRKDIENSTLKLVHEQREMDLLDSFDQERMKHAEEIRDMERSVDNAQNEYFRMKDNFFHEQLYTERLERNIRMDRKGYGIGIIKISYSHIEGLCKKCYIMYVGKNVVMP